MKMLTFFELKPGMVVVPFYKNKSKGRKVVVLNVTWKDLVNGMNTDHAGLHGFRGLWYYLGNPKSLMNKSLYGKIEYLGMSRYWKYLLVKDSIKGLSEKELTHLLDN